MTFTAACPATRQASTPTVNWRIRACQLKRNVMDTLTVEVEKTRKAARGSLVDWINSDVLMARAASMQLSSAITRTIAETTPMKLLAVSLSHNQLSTCF
jgi:hypothetical protein